MSPPPLALAPASTRARMASRLALVFIGATERQDRTAFRVTRSMCDRLPSPYPLPS
jgi:hypothetical protein